MKENASARTSHMESDWWGTPQHVGQNQTLGCPLRSRGNVGEVLKAVNFDRLDATGSSLEDRGCHRIPVSEHTELSNANAIGDGLRRALWDAWATTAAALVDRVGRPSVVQTVVHVTVRQLLVGGVANSNNFHGK